MLANLLIGMGEITLAPALISSATYLAPKKLQSTFIGFWTFSCAFSGYLGSVLAKISTTHSAQKAQLTLGQAGAFAHTFLLIAEITFGVGIFAILCMPWLKQLIDAK